MVPFVVCALHQEAFAGSSAVASNDPLPDHSSSTVVLPFAELRLVDLHDVPPSSDLPGCSVPQCAREPNFLQKVSIFLEQAYFHFKTTLSNLKLHEKSFKRVFKTIRRIFDIIY